MAKETVQAVRQAELKAAQIEKEAIEKREIILQKAKEEAKKIISSAEKEDRDLSLKDLEKVQSQGTELMKTAVQRAEREILLMNEMVKRKEPAAIDLVLSEIS